MLLSIAESLVLFRGYIYREVAEIKNQICIVYISFGSRDRLRVSTDRTRLIHLRAKIHLPITVYDLTRSELGTVNKSLCCV